MSAQGSTGRPVFAPEQEVRFAVVLYGGVSLAVYMNGVAQELFNLVKATAPEVPYPEGESRLMEPRVYFADADADGTRPFISGTARTYREVAQWLGVGGAAQPEPDSGDPPPVRTRFVIDIISGTSAGGINGVFLAKAIANQLDFSPSADLWVDVGDIEQLLRGKASWAGMPHVPGREPESLLNGYRLYWEAREAMSRMEAGRAESPGDPFRPAYAEQLDLAITATDLAGLRAPVQISADRSVSERLHRKVFNFEYGTEATTGEWHSDFADGSDLMLAFAARATSSFPLAFEPVALADLEAIDSDYATAEPARYFPGYHAPAEAFLADGGYLDNKPFSYATRALRRRRADVPVLRKLVFIEPHPASDDGPAQPCGGRPGVFRNALNGMVGLPRFESIRQDIADVADRNHSVARLREIELDAERAIRDGRVDEGTLKGPGFDAYRTLRARTVLDGLALVASQLAGSESDDRRAVAAREALRQWSNATQDAKERLTTVDVAFARRRLSFMQDRASELARGGERARRMATMAQECGLADEWAHGEGIDPAQAEALRGVKLALNKAHDGLRRAERAPEARVLEDVLSGAQLKRFRRLQAASQRLAEDPGDYVEAMRRFLAEPLEQIATGMAAAVQAGALKPWIRRLLAVYADQFELFDSIVLPLAHPDLGEANVVDIRRISPLDAPATVPEHVAAVDKLAGVQLLHFGAFLERSWRENDLMWGRLDATEAILDTLLPGEENEALRAKFRVRAQSAILRESLRDRGLRETLKEPLERPATDDNDSALVAAFRKHYRSPSGLDLARAQALTGQSVRAAAEVLATASGSRRILAASLLAIGRAAPTVVRAVGLAARARARLSRLKRRPPRHAT